MEKDPSGTKAAGKMGRHRCKMVAVVFVCIKVIDCDENDFRGLQY